MNSEELMRLALGLALLEAAEVTNPNQHCTSTECPYTHSHTGHWCGHFQPRRCGCAFCYEDERQFY